MSAGRHRLAWVSLAVVLVLVPGPVHAHLVSTGIGTFYDGLIHLYLSPEALLPVLALAVLSGMTGAPTSRIVALAFPLAWLAGSVLGLQSTGEQHWPWLTITSFIGLGALIGFGLRLPLMGVIMLAVLTAGTHGFVNASGVGDISAPVTYLAGSVTGVFIPVLIGSACAVSLRREWQVIAVRALGSWLAAVGILMLGWSLGGMS